MTNEKYAVFLDIDGTLYSSGIPEENKNAIKKARENGHMIFINSGRAMGNIGDEIRSVGFDGYVAGIGCNIIYGDETLLSKTVSFSDAAWAIDHFGKTDRTVVLEGERLLISNHRYEREDIAFVKSSEELKERFKNERITKIFVPHVLEKDEYDFLSKKFLVYQHPGYAEYSQKGCTKATGMEIILKHCGIDRAHSIAMGDSSNDTDMLKYAGISVAMGDAEEEIKSICDYVSCPAAEGGVAKALYKFLNI